MKKKISLFVTAATIASLAACSSGHPAPVKSSKPSSACAYMTGAITSETSKVDADANGGNVPALVNDINTLRDQTIVAEGLPSTAPVDTDLHSLYRSLGLLATDLQAYNVSQAQADAAVVQTDLTKLQTDCGKTN